jgi:PKD domain
MRVNDGPKGQSSGVNTGSVHVSFGDGRSAHGRAKLRHRYASRGSYTITVMASDKAGNKVTTRRLVSVS